MEINPETAGNLGIKDGNWVWIESPRGRCKQICKYFEGIAPGVVHAQHGWWFPEDPGEEPSLHGVWKSNINILTDDDPNHCNPINGGVASPGIAVQSLSVRKLRQFLGG